MDHSKAMEIITEHLITYSVEPNLLEEAQRHVANCHQCINELDASITILTGEPSTLAEKASKLLTCDECSKLLPEYSELEKDVAQEKYPLVWSHLQGCTRCNEDYETLFDLVQKERTGVFDPPVGPKYGEIWVSIKENWYRLIKEIKIKIDLQAKKLKVMLDSSSFRITHQTLTPAISRDGSEPEAEEIKIPLPEFNGQVIITIMHTTEGVEVKVQPVIPEAKTSRQFITVGLYDLNNNSLIRQDSIYSDEIQIFQILSDDNCSVRIKWNEKIYEVPLNISNE